MKNVEITRHGDYQVATAEGSGGGFTAWAKKGVIVTDCPIKEPGEDVWFNFGRTREAALDNLVAELNTLENEQ